MLIDYINSIDTRLDHTQKKYKNIVLKRGLFCLVLLFSFDLRQRRLPRWTSKHKRHFYFMTVQTKERVGHLKESDCHHAWTHETQESKIRARPLVSIWIDSCN